MENDGQYRVTRGGREIFLGTEDQLAAAAREGRFNANDLVFDPDADSWIFARSHKVITDAADGRFARRKPRRERAPRARSSSGESLRLKKADKPDYDPERARHRRRLVGVALLLAIIGGLVLAIPWSDDGSALSRFLEDRDTPAEHTVVASEGGAPAGGPANAPPPPQDDLVFAPGMVEPGGERIEPSDAERRRYADQYMAKAQQTLNDTDAPPGDERQRELLAAIQQAEFAKLNMERLDDPKAAREAAQETIDALKASFVETCAADHGERYCELKLKYPQWPHGVLRQVADEKVLVGMSSDQVRAAWGRPTRIRRVGNRVTWCFGQFCFQSVTLVNRTVVEVDE